MTTIVELEEGDLFYPEARLGSDSYRYARTPLVVCREMLYAGYAVFVEARAADGTTYWLGENRKVVKVGRHRS